MVGLTKTLHIGPTARRTINTSASSAIRKMQGKVNLACALKNFICTPGFDFPAVKIVYEVQLHTRHFGNSFLILQKKRNLVLTTPKIRKKRLISPVSIFKELPVLVSRYHRILLKRINGWPS